MDIKEYIKLYFFDPSRHQNLLKANLKLAFLLHKEMLRYQPFKFRNDYHGSPMIGTSDQEIYYGTLTEQIQGWLFGDEIERGLDATKLKSVKRNMFAWLFKRENDNFTYYMPDEYYVFSGNEKKEFLEIISVIAEIQEKLARINEGFIQEPGSVKGYYYYLLSRYIVMRRYLPQLLYQSDIPLLNYSEDDVLIKKNEKGEIISFQLSPLLYFQLRRLIKMFDFYYFYFGYFGDFLRDREGGTEEILINTLGPIQVMSGGRAVSIISVRTNEEVKSWINKMLVHRKELELTPSNPFVYAELPQGDRTTFGDKEVSENYTMNIRIFRDVPLSVLDFYKFGNFNIDLAGLMAVLMNIRSTILFSGGTGSGKTTGLSGFIAFAPEDRFYILGEDVKEMDPPHPPVFLRREVAKTPEYWAYILHALLRQSPDSLIIQELRKREETLKFLEAVSTGHEGSLSTFHANDISELLQRLLGMDIDPEMLKGLNYVVFLARMEDPSSGGQIRRYRSIDEIINVTKDGKVDNEKIYILSEFSDIKGDKTLFPIMAKVSRLLAENPTLINNFRNKYQMDPQNKEHVLATIFVHASFLRKLFHLIENHPWYNKKTKKFEVPNALALIKGEVSHEVKKQIVAIGKIEVSINEVLPRLVTYYYSQIYDHEPNSVEGLLKTHKKVMANFDKKFNEFIVELLKEKYRKQKDFLRRKEITLQKALTYFKYSIFETDMLTADQRKQLKNILQFIRMFPFDNYGPVIGSRVDILKYLDMIL